jgi:hypothetical protein
MQRRFIWASISWGWAYELRRAKSFRRSLSPWRCAHLARGDSSLLVACTFRGGTRCRQVIAIAHPSMEHLGRVINVMSIIHSLGTVRWHFLMQDDVPVLGRPVLILEFAAIALVAVDK